MHADASTESTNLVMLREGLTDDEDLTKFGWLRMKVEQLLFDWDCFPQWYAFAHAIESFIMDAFVDLLITFCIVLNTLFMAMETADMSPQMIAFLNIGNYVSEAVNTY